MENRLVVWLPGVKDGVEVGKKWVWLGGILVVMELFCILNVSMSVF